MTLHLRHVWKDPHGGPKGLVLYVEGVYKPAPGKTLLECVEATRVQVLQLGDDISMVLSEEVQEDMAKQLAIEAQASLDNLPRKLQAAEDELLMQKMIYDTVIARRGSLREEGNELTRLDDARGAVEGLRLFMEEVKNG